MMYNKLVEEYFFQPKHVGVLDINGLLTVHFCSAQNNQSFTRMDLYLQGSCETLITKARFKARGNPYAIAALEWLCRQIEGKKIDPPFSKEQQLYQIVVEQLQIPNQHYPIALQTQNTYEHVLILMKKKLEDLSHECSNTSY